MRSIGCWRYRLATTGRLIAPGPLESGRFGCGVFRDGLANADGMPNTDMPPATTRVTIEEVDVGRTHMRIDSSFLSAEAMEWVVATGTDVGRTQAVGQIDAILAEQTIRG
jgi:hypothetical protein